MAPNKINVKDRLTDRLIDLSMSDLEEVPVKEIATLKKANELDLSNNRIHSLPPTFGTLLHITKLDLSKNEITELPEEFGDLIKLKYLDLYFNKLQYLPLSFSKLKALTWLDLKDNPLIPSLAKVAGPCLEQKQCQICARDVVNFFGRMQAQVDFEKESRQKQRQKDIEKMQQKKQDEKKIRKKEKAKLKQVVNNLKEAKSEIVDSQGDEAVVQEVKILKPERGGSFCKHLFFSFLASCVILFVLSAIKVEHTQSVEYLARSAFRKGMEVLPESYKIYGARFGDAVNEAHIKTGTVTSGLLLKGQELGIYQAVCGWITSVVGKLQEIYVTYVN